MINKPHAAAALLKNLMRVFPLHTNTPRARAHLMDLPRLAQLPLDVLAVKEVPEDELVFGQSAPGDDQRQGPSDLHRGRLT